jgi:plasmid stabilization system protein ParE
MKLVVRRAAKRDLAEARDWYEQRRPGLGRQLVEAVSESLDKIRGHPELYPRVSDRVRRARISRFPYGIFYLLELGTVRCDRHSPLIPLAGPLATASLGRPGGSTPCLGCSYPRSSHLWSCWEKAMSHDVERPLDAAEEVFLDEAQAEIHRVREARSRISERFGHDPYRLVAHYMEQQKEHPERLVSAPEPERKEDSAA